jgi:hypothetical protein
VRGNESGVPAVVSWLPDTDVEHALQKVQMAQRNLEDAKKELNGFKKGLHAL